MLKTPCQGDFECNGDFSTTNASAFLQKGGNPMKILDEKERTAKIAALLTLNRVIAF